MPPRVSRRGHPFPACSRGQREAVLCHSRPRGPGGTHTGLRTHRLPDRPGKCPWLSRRKATSLVVGYLDIPVSLTARPARMQKLATGQQKGGAQCHVLGSAPLSLTGEPIQFFRSQCRRDKLFLNPNPHCMHTRREGWRAPRAKTVSVWGVSDLSEDLAKAVNASPPKFAHAHVAMQFQAVLSSRRSPVEPRLRTTAVQAGTPGGADCLSPPEQAW